MKGKYNTGVHSALLAAVGAYILYIAWVLLDKYRSTGRAGNAVLRMAYIPPWKEAGKRKQGRRQPGQ